MYSDVCCATWMELARGCRTDGLKVQRTKQSAIFVGQSSEVQDRMNLDFYR
jgi:hypothetical protein